MATNKTMDGFGWEKSVQCSHPGTPTSGQPVRLGSLTGIALVDESDGGNASGYTSVDFGPGEWDLSVVGADDAGSSAVAVGEPLYYVDADHPRLSKKASGRFFGVAMETVNSGGTATVKVQHVAVGAPGAGLSQGYVPINLASIRFVASNDFPNVGTATTTNGGVLAQNTAPKLERINDATDKNIRVVWAASDVTEVHLVGFAYPPDLDPAQPVVVHMLAKMAAGGMDTPTLDVGYFEGVGDTNAGTATAALSTTLAEKTVVVAAGDIGSPPTTAAVTVTPGTHNNEAVELYGAWLTYGRV